jgi:hypothetical protein
MRLNPGNDLILGTLAGGKTTLTLPRTARDKHLYVCGGTGTGKSKFLESLIRQDILAWRKSKCGMLVLDPHGSLYDSVIRWMAWNNLDRPVVPIDLRQDDWVVAYNVLRRRSADPAVLIDNLIDAMAHVWGQGGTDATPLFARWAGNIIRSLYEKELTLIDAEHLIDRVNRAIRYAITHDLSDKAARQDWQFASTLTPEKFEAQIGSTINRLQRFIRNQTMRSTFGQTTASMDLGSALEEGQIIIVSLATEGAKVSSENSKLFATLLLSDLWTAAQERGKREGVKPFYVYLDEFQRFVTPTIAENLDEARGYGLHLTMAHQFPKQLLNAGEHGKRLYDSVMENASSKVVFRLSDEENLMPIAKWLFRGTMDPDEVKHEMYSTKVMEYREELKEVRGQSTSTSTSHGSQRGSASGSGVGGTHAYRGDGTGAEPNSTSESESDFSATSESENTSYAEGSTESVSLIPTIVPVLGKELSHVQFRSLEEQLFRSMAVLFDQQERFNTTRIVGMKAPVSLRTPDVSKSPGKPERAEKYLASRYAKIPFALTGETARKQLAELVEKRPAELMDKLAMPAATKRRIR